MAATTSIQWTEKTWNPVRGCSIVSPGCVNCYAMKQAHRFSGPGQPYEGLTHLSTRSGPQWTGQIRLVEDALLEPLKWRKPALVFVNSMSDLFHEGVPDEFIDQVFAVMACANRHTYQVLTKRPERMRDYLTSRARSAQFWKNAARTVGYALEREGFSLVPFPLPNVWLGVSVENQETADARIPLVLQTPAAVRFVSAEPLLGGIDIGKHRPGALGLHWLIVGGESGPGARPCETWWIKNLIGQCLDADVRVFVKQLGANAIDGITKIRYVDRKGGDPSEWPTDLRVREFPGGA